MPVLLTRSNPEDIARPDLFHRASVSLSPATTSGHNQRLPEGMRVPCGSGTGLKCNARSLNPSRLRALQQWINSYRASEPFCRAST